MLHGERRVHLRSAVGVVAVAAAVLGLREGGGIVFALIPDRIYATVAAVLLLFVNGVPMVVYWSRQQMPSTGFAIALSLHLVVATAAVLGNLSFARDHFGLIFRRMVWHEVASILEAGVEEKQLRYHFDYPAGAEPFPGGRPAVVGDGFYDWERYNAAMERSRGVDTDAYLQDILERLGVGDGMPARQKAATILRFVQRAIVHDPYGQAPLAHPVVLLEYGRAHCTKTNQYALRTLLEKAGIPTRNVSLFHHSVIEADFDGAWRMLDADMLDTLVTRPNGEVPSVAWLQRAPNHHLLDAHKRVRYHFHRPLSVDGRRVTGNVSTYRTEDHGYQCYHYGAPHEFPPSRPRLLQPSVATSDGSLDISWDRSYDRDHDLDHYVVDVGTTPGGGDLGSFSTEHPSLSLVLPREGRYYYRVRGVDRHAPRDAGVHYLESEEGVAIFDAALANQFDAFAQADRPSLATWGVEDGVSVGGFQLLQGDGTYTDVFNVPWRGTRALRLVDLSDRFSEVEPRAQVYSREIAGTDQYRLRFDLELERSGYGQSPAFPLLRFGHGNDWVETELFAVVLDPGADVVAVSVGGQTSLTMEVSAKGLQLFNFDFLLADLLVARATSAAGTEEAAFARPALDGRMILEVRSNPVEEVDFVLGNLALLPN